MVCIAPEDHKKHEEDEEPKSCESVSLRIVVCMTKEGSRGLLKAEYLQCDIGFKRVLGFQEFELAGTDRSNNISAILFLLKRHFVVANELDQRCYIC